MHKQAAKTTLIVTLAAIMTGLGVTVILNYIPIQALLWIGAIGFVAYMIWIFYTMEKGRLETLEELKKQ